MRHLFWMMVFAALTAIVFGAIGKGTSRERLWYGVKVFGEFVLIGLALGWVLYFLPFK